MAEAPYLMGIDLGTGGVRVGLFDRQGSPAGFRSVGWETSHPRPGWAEQDPGQWWTCLVQAVRGLLETSGVPAEEVAGVSVDATAATVVATDADGRHLRPAIMWMDVRAADQARRVQETGDPALKYNGFGPVSAELGLPKALWLKEREPDIWRAAARVVDCADWAVQRLTGEAASSIDTVSGKFYYDRDEGGFPERLYAAVGVEDLLEKYPGKVLDLGAAVGGLRGEVAAELGLQAGTPVAEGGIDAHVGALGLGVVEPGMAALITGSSHVIIGQAAEAIHDPGFWGVPAGAEGLVVLDYFQGNRSPYTDPHARGLISGLSLRHRPEHLFRAILEGICYGTELIFRTLRRHGFELRTIVAGGGATRSELWMQLHADVSNVPISVTRQPESPTLGAAMLAAVGAGIHPDLQTAAAEMVHTERTIEPDPGRHQEYRFYLDRYAELYPLVKDVMHATTAHVAGNGGVGNGAPDA